MLTVLLLSIACAVQCQDSLSVSLIDADKMFLQRNLLLIAGQLNVDAQKAMEIQARLYPNPQFTIGLNAYDGVNKKPFYIGSNGEKSFEFDQLILLGGKRKNQVELAKQNTKQAQLELEELLRNLKYKLHNSLYSLHFDMLTASIYSQQLMQLDTIITAYDAQAKKRNIPLKEVVRLKSVYIALNNDRMELLQSIRQQQQDLQIILQVKQPLIANIEDNVAEQFNFLPVMDSLQNIASVNRADIRLGELNKNVAELNYKYQKSFSVPDLTVGTSYEQRGAAFNDQYSFNVGIPLPLWNRNQGNIKSSRIQSKLIATNTEFQKDIVYGEVATAWNNMKQSMQEYQKTIQVYNADFVTVYDGTKNNFLKRNVSIVEFVDYFESYNQTIAEVNRIRKQVALSAETINYTVAYPVY